MAINLRPATANDAVNLLKWKNEEDTRKNSIVSDKVITMENHLGWLHNTLANPMIDFWIIEDDGVPVGDVRLNHSASGEAEISIRMDKAYRGKGTATAVIGMVEPVGVRFVAKIRAHNLASMRVFISNGYKPYEFVDGSTPYYIFKK